MKVRITCKGQLVTVVWEETVEDFKRLMYQYCFIEELKVFKSFAMHFENELIIVFDAIFQLYNKEGKLLKESMSIEDMFPELLSVLIEANYWDGDDSQQE